MTKQELVINVANSTQVDQATVEKVVNTTMASIVGAMSAGSTIYLRGFGTFLPKVRKAKVGRNISKGTSVLIPEHRIPFFKPGKDFKRLVR